MGNDLPDQRGIKLVKSAEETLSLSLNGNRNPGFLGKRFNGLFHIGFAFFHHKNFFTVGGKLFDKVFRQGVRETDSKGFNFIFDTQVLDGITYVVVTDAVADDAPGTITGRKVIFRSFGYFPGFLNVFQKLDVQFSRNGGYGYQVEWIFGEIAPGIAFLNGTKADDACGVVHACSGTEENRLQ